MRVKGQRRKWTARKKLRIVLAGLDGTTQITELCRREDINTGQFYCWRNQLLRAATIIFDGSRSRHRQPSKRG